MKQQDKSKQLKTIHAYLDAVMKKNISGALGYGAPGFANGRLEIPLLENRERRAIACIGEAKEKPHVYITRRVNDVWVEFSDDESEEKGLQAIEALLKPLVHLAGRLPPIRPDFTIRAREHSTQQAGDAIGVREETLTSDWGELPPEEGRKIRPDIDMPEHLSFDLDSKSPALPSVPPVTPTLLDIVEISDFVGECEYYQHYSTFESESTARETASARPPKDWGLKIIYENKLMTLVPRMPPVNPLWAYAARFQSQPLFVRYEDESEDAGFAFAACTTCGHFGDACLGYFVVDFESEPLAIELSGFDGLPPRNKKEGVKELKTSKENPFTSALESLVSASLEGYARFRVAEGILPTGFLHQLKRLGERFQMRFEP